MDYCTLGCIPLPLNWDWLVRQWQCISILVSPCLFSPRICSALSHCLHKATLYGLCISAGGTPCYTHIIWSSGNRPRRQKKSHMHTQIHICLLRSPFLPFIFYSKVISRNKKIWQSSQSDKKEGRCVCVCVVLKIHLRTPLLFFLSSSPAVSRGAL